MTLTKIKIYIALVLYHRIIWKTSFEFYYIIKSVFEIPILNPITPYNQLCLLNKFLHFVDNKSFGESYDKITEIRAIHEYLSKKLQNMYIIKQNLANNVAEKVSLFMERPTEVELIFYLKSLYLSESKIGYISSGKSFVRKFFKTWYKK